MTDAVYFILFFLTHDFNIKCVQNKMSKLELMQK